MLKKHLILIIGNSLLVWLIFNLMIIGHFYQKNKFYLQQLKFDKSILNIKILFYIKTNYPVGVNNFPAVFSTNFKATSVTMFKTPNPNSVALISLNPASNNPFITIWVL